MILIVSPANDAVNSLAEDVSKDIMEYQANGVISEQRYVIRLYSKNTEEQIRLRTALETVPRQPDARPQIGDVAMYELDQVSVLTRRAFDEEHATKYDRIRDKRVQHLNLSAGHRMLIIAGIYDEDQAQAASEWTDFRQLYYQRVDPENPLDKDQL